MSVKLVFDTNKVLGKQRALINQRQPALDAQVLKDSNFYIPKDEGTLEASGVIASKIGSGRIEWNTPYAREQYYERPNKSTDTNPNARMKWFEVAKAAYLDLWLKIAGATK